MLDGVSALAETERLTPEAALGRVVAEAAVAATSLAALGQLRDGWLRDPRGGYERGRGGGPFDARRHRGGAGRVGVGAEVRSGTAIRIATGAPVPRGADAVVPVEATSPVDAAGDVGGRGRDATGPLPSRILVHEVVPPGGSIRRAGSDVEAGALLREPGDVVTPAAVALLAGSGVTELVVSTAPRGRGARDGRRGAWARRGAGTRGHPRCERAGRPVARPAGGRRGAGAGYREGSCCPMSRTGCGAPSRPARTRSSSRAASRSVRMTWSGSRSSSWPDRSLWRVAVQPGKPFAFGARRRERPTPCSCSACRATRSRRS